MSKDSSAPSFSELGLSSETLQAVEDLGYQAPSPVQAEAIPHVLAGRDVLAAAQTGTGKTAAFVLPVMSQIRHHRKHEGPFCLVVTPTRELAQQIVDVCDTVGQRTGHRTVSVVGGVSYNPQCAALSRGVDVLVATPGRLEDLIGTGDARLDQVQVLVLDEADRMLDMGFLPSIRRIVEQCPKDRQTLLFSATLDEAAIEGVRDLVHGPARVEIARRGATAETIDQYALPVSPEVKNGLLAKVLEKEGHDRVIVFCRTKHRADAVCRRLTKAGIQALPIHGNRSQAQREKALKAFRDGRCQVLVATDVLARGIDVPDVDYVVNFDAPADPEDYVHRIGRTGRAGEPGWALTFVTPDDVENLLATEALMGRVVPAFPRADAYELGENLPTLDPERVPATVRDAPSGGKHRKSRTKAAAAKAVRQQARQPRPQAKASAQKKGNAPAKPKSAAKSKAQTKDTPKARTGAKKPTRPAGSKTSKPRKPKQKTAVKADSAAQWQTYSGPRKQRPHNGGRRRPGDKGAR